MAFLKKKFFLKCNFSILLLLLLIHLRNCNAIQVVEQKSIAAFQSQILHFSKENKTVHLSTSADLVLAFGYYNFNGSCGGFNLRVTEPGVGDLFVGCRNDTIETGPIYFNSFTPNVHISLTIFDVAITNRPWCQFIVQAIRSNYAAAMLPCNFVDGFCEWHSTHWDLSTIPNVPPPRPEVSYTLAVFQSVKNGLVYILQSPVVSQAHNDQCLSFYIFYRRAFLTQNETLRLYSIVGNSRLPVWNLEKQISRMGIWIPVNVSLPNSSSFQLQFEVLLTIPRAIVAIADINVNACSDDASVGLEDEMLPVVIATKNHDDDGDDGDISSNPSPIAGTPVLRRWFSHELGCVRFRCRRAQPGALTSVVALSEQRESTTQLFIDDSTHAGEQIFTIDLTGLSNYFLSLMTISDLNGDGSAEDDIINVDDISTFPVGHDQCLSRVIDEPMVSNYKSCDFEDQAMCAFGLTMNSYSSWDLLGSSAAVSNQSSTTSPYIWHTIFNTDRAGFVANASAGMIGDKAELQTSIFYYSPNIYRCLTFSYAIAANPTLSSPTMTVEFSNLTEQITTLANLSTSNGRWIKKSINISHLRSNRSLYWHFSFRASSGGTNSYVAIDDIILTEQSCNTQLPLDCSFEMGNSCGWLEQGWSFDFNQHGLITWRSSVIENVPENELSQLMSPFFVTSTNNQRFCIALNFSVESYLLPTKPSLSVNLVQKMSNGSEFIQQIANLSLADRNDENGNFIIKLEASTHFDEKAVKISFHLLNSDVGFVKIKIHSINIFDVNLPNECSFDKTIWK